MFFPSELEEEAINTMLMWMIHDPLILSQQTT